MAFKAIDYEKRALGGGELAKEFGADPSPIDEDPHVRMSAVAAGERGRAALDAQMRYAQVKSGGRVILMSYSGPEIHLG